MSSNKDIAARFYEAFNANKPDMIDSFVSENIIEHTPNPMVQGDPNTRDYAKKVITTFKSAFPDLTIKPEHAVEEGDLVVTHLTGTGTQTGQLGPIPPTGKRGTVNGFDMVRVKDGKIVEHWGVVDMMSMMQQLGVAPGNGASDGSGNTPRG